MEELEKRVARLEEMVKKIVALPQLSRLAGRDAEILNHRVKGTKFEYLAEPAVPLTNGDSSATEVQKESDITTERVKFLWDLFRPNSPCYKTVWIDLKKEKPYLFDD